MNISKIDKILDIKVNENLNNEEESLVLFNGTSTESNLIKYTENPQVIKEINRYIDERENSLGSLIEARKNIVSIIKDNNFSNSVKTGLDWKDIDAFSKLLNTLSGLTKQIDDLSNPQKVETYLDPQENIVNNEFSKVTNIQNNYVVNPADLIRIIKEGEISNNDDS